MYLGYFDDLFVKNTFSTNHCDITIIHNNFLKYWLNVFTIKHFNTFINLSCNL